MLYVSESDRILLADKGDVLSYSKESDIIKLFFDILMITPVFRNLRVTFIC